MGYHFRIGNGGSHLILDSEQDGGLQAVVFDRVHGAGRPGAVLVGGAGIIDIFPALAPGDGFPAVSAFQKAAEQMELPALWGCPGIAEQEGLHPVKGFMGDDGLVGIGYTHPFLLRHSLDLVYLVAFHPAAALHQIPGINVLLGRRITALLRRSGQAPLPQTITFGDVIVDFSGYTASDSTGKIDIMPKEIDLLRLLVEHRELVLTRSQILDELWGANYPIIDRTVDTYIKNLRKKLRLDCIVTVKGIGYKYEVQL